MITPITARFPALNFPKEVDYPTQEDWAAFSAAAELNYGILSGEWSDKSEEFKAQTNNLALEIQEIGENAFNAITLDTVDDLATYTGTGLAMVKDINRGGIFVSKTVTEIDPNTGSLYVANEGTVFAALCGGFWVRQYSGAVNVKWFGAKGDGVTDDTVAIQSALNYGNQVTFDSKMVSLVNPDEGLILNNNQQVNFCGATVKSLASSTSGYTIFTIREVDNVSIANGTIIGDRNIHIGTEGEWGNGIGCYASLNIHIKNMVIEDCWGDGIYFGVDNSIDRNGSSNVIVEKTIIKNSRRNNVSVIALKHGSFLQCSFIGANGTLPEAGVDLEPNNVLEEITDIVFDNCVFESNIGGGLITAGPIANSANIIVKNCTFLSNKGNLLSQIQNTIVTDCYIDGSTSTVNYIGGVTLRDGVIKNNIIKNIVRAGIGVYGDESLPGQVSIEGNYIVESETSLYIESKHTINFSNNECINKNHIIRQASNVKSLRIVNNRCSLSLYNSSYSHFRFNAVSEKEVLIKDNIFLSLEGVTNTQNSIVLNSLTSYSIYGNDWKGWGDATPIYGNGAAINYGYGNNNTTGTWA